MKTGTKIFIWTIAAAVVFCGINALVVAPSQHKAYDSEAQRLARQLGSTPVRIVYITLPEGEKSLRSHMNLNGWLINYMERYSRSDDHHRSLNIPAGSLESVRISADTLYYDRADRTQSGYWRIFSSPELELVVFHYTDGRYDEAFDYREPRPEPEATQIEPEGH